MERIYSQGSLTDYVFYQDYTRKHPEAVYVTSASRSELGPDQAFSPENAVKQLKQYYGNGSYPLSPMNSLENIPLTGYSEDYIVIFYDKDFKAISYYIGTLAD